MMTRDSTFISRAIVSISLTVCACATIRPSTRAIHSPSGRSLAAPRRALAASRTGGAGPEEDARLAARINPYHPEEGTSNLALWTAAAGQPQGLRGGLKEGALEDPTPPQRREVARGRVGPQTAAPSKLSDGDAPLASRRLTLPPEERAQNRPIGIVEVHCGGKSGRG